MNITFLVGNGFDIGIGLKTQYEDFYKEYCVVTKDDNKNIQEFKKMLQKRDTDELLKIIDWADFEIAFGKHSEEFKIEEKELYIERFEDFVSKFNTYLETEENAADYTDENKIAETMKTAVTTYFHVRDRDKAEIQETYNKITDKRVYNIVSFNYTRSIDNCARILSNKLKSDNNRAVGRIAHIHGYIDFNMIMGVNDASQITNTDFANDIDVSSEIVKPQQNTDARTRYENEVISIINDSHTICIYGMSIGATDKKWWNIISKWLSGHPLRRLVILKYDKNYNSRFTYTQRKFTNDIVDKFLSYSDLEDDKKTEIKNRIYVGGNHNVFSMNLRKEDNSEQNDNIVERVEVLEEEISKKISVDDVLVLNGGTANGWK